MTSERLKVVTIVGTRPEIVKLSRVLRELDSHTDHLLAHTGQNYDYELNEIFFRDLGLRKPDVFMDAARDRPAATIAAVIERSDELLQEHRPDAVLLYGDTNSCLAVIAAKKNQIPIFHMEAGNRCFDQRVPEELNRRVVDHLSDVNMTNSEHARRYLLAEGLRPELVINTGSPMREIIESVLPLLSEDSVLRQEGLEPRRFFLVSCHREENVDDPTQLRALVAGLGELAAEYRLPIVVSTHPRTRARLEALGDDIRIPGVRWTRPLGFLHYLTLQRAALCVISDSGTLTEEASILNLRAVMIRESHERPEGIDVGVVPFVGLASGRLAAAVRLVVEQHSDDPRHRNVPDYRGVNVAQTVVRIILSYTDYVNRVVWHRSRA